MCQNRIPKRDLFIVVKKEMDRHFNILTNTDFKMYEYSLFQSRLSGKQDSQKMVTWKKKHLVFHSHVRTFLKGTTYL